MSKWVFLFLGNQRQLFQIYFSSWFYCLMSATIQNRSLEFLKSSSYVMASWPVEGRLLHMVMGYMFACCPWSHLYPLLTKPQLCTACAVCVHVWGLMHAAHRLEMFEKGKKAHYLFTKICKLLEGH